MGIGRTSVVAGLAGIGLAAAFYFHGERSYDSGVREGERTSVQEASEDLREKSYQLGYQEGLVQGRALEREEISQEIQDMAELRYNDALVRVGSHYQIRLGQDSAEEERREIWNCFGVVEERFRENWHFVDVPLILWSTAEAHYAQSKKIRGENVLNYPKPYPPSTHNQGE